MERNLWSGKHQECERVHEKRREEKRREEKRREEKRREEKRREEKRREEKRREEKRREEKRRSMLPLACLGAHGEDSTRRHCNYSALAQQLRAKGASKGFPLSHSIPSKENTACVNHTGEAAAAAAVPLLHELCIRPHNMLFGGKDSCYNMMQCVAAGHTIVALANLRPAHTDELDSYMYQTVGHQAIELYAEAMDLPLYRRTIKGSSVDTSREYSPNHADEVEDLYQLLQLVKEKEDVEAVSVGAILSDYQRVRVENVCSRLQLQPLAYLWRREQADLLNEMISSGLQAFLIKVAAYGEPAHTSEHAGRVDPIKILYVSFKPLNDKVVEARIVSRHLFACSRRDAYLVAH
ncbi:Diphthine--ammonia ligase [Bagarius yarrelli]|uniref:Diphthine--ammonia ligase n=1 Tax=Bagarius yarrelli TaxID=175774 RepID=A0A556U513_BAGYA|nr:Diphthine--ammonia ligase [Bagarius yarrelli]